MSDKYDGLGLSEEEIAAMEEELGGDTGVEAEADDADEVTEKPEAEEAAKADADDAGTEEPEEEPEAAKAEPEAKVEEPTPAADPVPSALGKLNADLVALKKQFDEGEVSIDEYIDAKSALDRQIVKAELKAELAQESANKSWEQSQKE